MSFKIFLALIFVCSCGVKGDPVPPKTPHTPSLLQNYPDIQTEKVLDDVKSKPQTRR